MAIGAGLLISLAVSGGGMALQYLFRPRIKQEPIDKGKLDDIRITGSEYGAFIPRLWGKGRLGGNLIWSNGIQHTIITTPSGGGKGVPQAPATRTHVYRTSIAVLISRGTVNNFYRMWADADLILGNGTTATGNFEAENETLAGGASVEVDVNASGGEYVGNLGNGGKVTFDFSSVPDPPFPQNNDPDEAAVAYTRVSYFYKCPADRQAAITLNSGSAPTITFAATGADWATQTANYSGFVDTLEFANPSGDAPDLDYILIEKYWLIEPFPSFRVTGAVNENIIYPLDIDDPSEYYNAAINYDGTGKAAVQTSIAGEQVRFYKGTETQTQDAAIVAWLDSRYGTGEGVLRASAHRGLSCVIFDNRQLRQGRVENFTFEIDANDNDVNDVLEDLFAEVGIEDYDLTATASFSQIGFLEHTNTSRRQLCEYLARYHFFRFAEIDGEIKTVADSFTPIAAIDQDSLRAHNDTEEMPERDGEIIIQEDHLKPREVRVSVMNPDLEYHNESVPAQLFASTTSTESKEYTFPIVDQAAEARTVAEKLLLKEHAEDKAIEFWGMPETAKYSIGDVVAVPLGGQTINVRIEKKQMTLPLGKVRFQCVSVNPFVPSVYQNDVTSLAVKPDPLFASYNFPRNSVVVPIQSVAIEEKHKDRLGVYLAVSGRGRGAAENITLLREYDDENFVIQSVIDTPSVVGLCEDVLGTKADVTTEDTTNVLDIWFFDDIELESVLQADIDRYPALNLLRVGDEWIQFRTATAQTLEENSPYRSKWRVSNLWRGRFETEDAVSTHAADEYAVLYTPAVKFYDLEKEDVGKTLTFKAVTNGQAEENGQTSSFEFSPLELPGEELFTSFTIDLTDTGFQTAYTVPAGFDLYVTKFVFHSPSDDFTGEVETIETLTGVITQAIDDFTATDKYIVRVVDVIASRIGAGDDLQFQLTDAISKPGTVTADVFGYLREAVVETHYLTFGGDRLVFGGDPLSFNP